jgi:hypothetical protein
VRVTRDAEGGKGATLTTNVSLAGRFLVYFPYDPRRDVSRKVEDESLRRNLREKAKDLDREEDEGFIVRTNAAEAKAAGTQAGQQRPRPFLSGTGATACGLDRIGGRDRRVRSRRDEGSAAGFAGGLRRVHGGPPGRGVE